jgi:hypothetical protein
MNNLDILPWFEQLSPIQLQKVKEEKEDERRRMEEKLAIQRELDNKDPINIDRMRAIKEKEKQRIDASEITKNTEQMKYVNDKMKDTNQAPKNEWLKPALIGAGCVAIIMLIFK